MSGTNLIEKVINSLERITGEEAFTVLKFSDSGDLLSEHTVVPENVEDSILYISISKHGYSVCEEAWDVTANTVMDKTIDNNLMSTFYTLLATKYEIVWNKAIYTGSEKNLDAYRGLINANIQTAKNYAVTYQKKAATSNITKTSIFSYHTTIGTVNPIE